MAIPPNIIELINRAIKDGKVSDTERGIIVETAKREGISEQEIYTYINFALSHNPPKGIIAKPQEASSSKTKYENSDSSGISPKIVLIIFLGVFWALLKIVSMLNKIEPRQASTKTTETAHSTSSSIFDYRYSTGEFYDKLSLKPSQPIATLLPLSQETAELIFDNRQENPKKRLKVYLIESQNPKLEIEMYPFYEGKSKASMYRLTITDPYGYSIDGLPYFDFKAHYEFNMLDMIKSTDFLVEETENKKEEILLLLKYLESSSDNLRYSLKALN